MKVSLSLLALVAGSAYASPKRLLYAPACCAADRCFDAARLPIKSLPLVSAFCEKYIHSTPVVKTVTAKTTVTTTVNPSASTVVVTSVSEASTVTTTSTACTTTVSGPLPTKVYYRTLNSGPDTRKREVLEERDPLGYAHAPTIPGYLSSGCKHASLPSAISSACRCFLKPSTATVTPTVTVTGPAGAPVTSTSVSISTSTSVSTACTTTLTSYSYDGASCGIVSPTAATSGTITCDAQPAGETGGKIRVEGSSSDGTVFEGCVSSSPRVIITASGGSHMCDGTNNDANQAPGATATTQLDEAANEAGFPYDGTYSAQFQDFFITSIDTSTQTSTAFWGLLLDRQFSQLGGCQTEIQPGGTQEVLWAYDAFEKTYFLHMSPDYAVVTSGTQSVTVTVTKADNNPASGAVIQDGGSGSTVDANGQATITVPTTPGCYQYKAELNDAIRSNAFYLTVL